MFKVLCVFFKNGIDVLLCSYVCESAQKMLPEEIIFCFDIIKGSFVLLIESFILFERVVYLIVFLMKLKPVLHDKFFSFSSLLKAHDFHLCPELLKLPPRRDEIIFKWLYNFLTVFDGFFELLDLFKLYFKGLFESIEMLRLFGLFCGTAIDTVIKLSIIQWSKQFLNLLRLVINYINRNNFLIFILQTL